MGRTPCIPTELTRSPFFLDEARDAGLTLSALSGKTWQRIGAELYRWKELPDDPWLTLSAWRRVLPPETVFVGATAAWLFGLDLEPTDPVEVAVPASSGLRSRAGLVVRRCEIPPAEIVSIRQLPATALPLTLTGLCLQLSPVEALVAIDMAVHQGLVDTAALSQYAKASKGRPGAARLRSLASLAASAESPMETRLRWLLIQAGLPQPEVQTDLRDSAARFVGRADLYYPAMRLVLEYDGGNHRERMVDDNRRQNQLVNAGYRVLRIDEFKGSFGVKRVEFRPVASVALVAGLRLRDSVDQAGDQRDQRREEPQAPPHRPRHPLHHLVSAEAAKPVERSGDSPAAAALVKLEAAMRAPRLLRVIKDHGRLVAPRAQARGDKR